MSRLRRLVACDRFYFITCRLSPPRERRSEREFEEEPQSPNSRDSALHQLADNLSLFCLAWHLRGFSSFCQSVMFLARIRRVRRSLGAHFEFVLSSFSKLDPVFSMT